MLRFLLKISQHIWRASRRIDVKSQDLIFCERGNDNGQAMDENVSTSSGPQMYFAQ